MNIRIHEYFTQVRWSLPLIDYPGQAAPRYMGGRQVTTLWVFHSSDISFNVPQQNLKGEKKNDTWAKMQYFIF